ncbi:DUF664 domain-containing protein [Nocardioides sp. 616]|uniref:mycothiol transferase n=1 Tax=Nocardioides sp. 616 TaxID=2268090 RepID=UPI000CE363B6|nr:DUF664 domain-containing protein [Nocardioides sp. 616]
MPEDQRIDRFPREPGKRGAAGAERWSDYLDWLRTDIVTRVTGMHSSESRKTRLPSGWTPIELLSHLMHMEQRWFIWGFLGEQVRDPWGDWNTGDPWASREVDDVREGPRWSVPDDVTVERIAERLEAVAERTHRILREHSLSEQAAVGGRFADHPPTLEWICFHVLSEYARHAGHLDIVAELGAE